MAVVREKVILCTSVVQYVSPSLNLLFDNMFQYAIPFLHMHRLIVLLSLHYFDFRHCPTCTWPGMYLQFLRLLVAHHRLKPLFELLDGHLLTIPVLHSTVDRLRWD